MEIVQNIQVYSINSNPICKIEDNRDYNKYLDTWYYNNLTCKVEDGGDCKKYSDIQYYNNPIYKIEKGNEALTNDYYPLLSSFNNSRIPITIQFL